MLIYIFVVITLWCLMKVSLNGSSIRVVVYYTLIHSIHYVLNRTYYLIFVKYSCSYIYISKKHFKRF